MEAIHRRTCVFQIGYHIVFCTKYRLGVLTGDLSGEIKKIVASIALEKGFDVSAIETGDDHVRMFVSAPPHISISVLVKWIKGITARKLFLQYPLLRKKLYRGHLWNPSFYVGTVGDMSEKSVKKYIDSQQKKA